MRILILTISLFISIYQSCAFSDTLNYPAFSNNVKVSIPITIAQSLLLPSYASYKSESYLLSSVQACIDLLPFYVLATADLRGEGAMVGIAFPFIWGINRLTAIPLNGLSAFIHNYRIDENTPIRYLPSFSDKAHFGLIAAYGCDNSVPYDNIGPLAGIELKLGQWRMTAFIPSSVTGSAEWSTLYGNSGNLTEVKYRVINHAISAFDYRIRIHKSMCINPGLTLDLFKSKYSYSRFIPSSNELPPVYIPLRSFEKTSYFICPKVSWEITRYKRFTFEHTVSFPVVVEHNLKSYYRETDKVMKKMFYTFSMNALIF